MNPLARDVEALISKSASRTELWTGLVRAFRATTVAEVGVWKGDFAKDMLEGCESIARYYMIDPWAHLPDWNKPFNVDAAAFDDVYAEAMAKTEFAAAKRVVLRGRTIAVVDQIPDESLDFAYIDGDHTLRGITIDLIRILPKIKEGGVIGGDDFVNTPWQHGVRFEPTLVCPFAVYFAEAIGLPIMGLPHNQFLIHKSKGTSFSFVDRAGKYADLSLNKLPSVWAQRGRRVLRVLGLKRK